MRSRSFAGCLVALMVLLSIPFCISISRADTAEYGDIVKAIGERKASWKAKETTISKRSTEARKYILAAEPFGNAGDENILATTGKALPSRLDWRRYSGGNYVTPAKDQGLCASGWSFAATAALESSLLISQNTPGSTLDLSEQALIACSSAGGCQGGWLNTASEFLRSVGLPAEGCYPYTATDGLCSNACADWPGSSSRISNWFNVSPTVQSLKYALYNFGPAVALMEIRTDFLFYGTGIYSPVWGSREGYHAVLIVGYDDAGQYFIVKNSWGADWGEDGYARISYSEIQALVSILAYQNAIPEAFPTVDGISRTRDSDTANAEGDLTASLSALQGTVKDKAGNAVGGADVKTGEKVALTDSAGKYTLPSVPAGDRVVTAGKSGYSTASENVTLKPGATTTKDFVLSKSETGETAAATGDEKVKDNTEILEKSTGETGPYKVAGPGWIFGKAPAVSPEKAEEYFAARRSEIPVTKTIRPSWSMKSGKMSQKTLKIVRDTHLADVATVESGAVTESREIEELARALLHDPLEIYNYVHMFVDYVPYYGSTKGANLTYADKNGNDFDQASLMIALLRASGYAAQYVYGTMTISDVQAANWLNAWCIGDIDSVLSDGGIPHTVSEANNTVTLNRVWVKVTIDNADYVFDPAFKKYMYYEKMDVGQAIGYVRSDFMTSATAGATVGSDYAQNINEANVRSKLTQYTTNLVSHIRNNNPNKSVIELFGGREIKENKDGQFRSSLLVSTTVTAMWDDIPEEYVTKMTINIPGHVSNHVARTDELNGSIIVLSTIGWEESRTTAMSMTITVDHPYAANGGTHGDQSATYTIHGQSMYNIPYSFGRGVNALRVELRKQYLDELLADYSSSEEDIILETLAVMGLVYMREESMVDERLSALYNFTQTNHHMVGLIAQEDSYYIDFRHIYSTFEGFGDLSPQIFLRSVNHSAGIFMSTFEHTVLEQTMGSDKPGVSTIKLMQIANASGRKVFRATSSNYAAIKQQLTNYSTSDLNNIQSLVNEGKVLILPDNGQLVLNKWKGQGYVVTAYSESTGETTLSMKIGGGLFGGFCSDKGYVEPMNYGTYGGLFSITEKPFLSCTVPNLCGGDPVDMARGAFLSARTDLTLNGSAPNGLTMARSYDSDKKYNKRTLGYGWTHNNDLFLKASSYADPVLGNRQPVDTASFVIALYITSDLMKAYDDTADAWMVSSLIGKWSGDHMTDNAVTAYLGDKGFEYIMLPDGTYAPPPGITTQLVKNPDGTFSLQERFGTRMNFNADKKISEMKDVDGNTMTFAYNADKNLTSIKDALGRTLTLSYTDGKISSVADSAGRSVSYTYDSSDNLTGYSDPEKKVWSYSYDTMHQILEEKTPLNITKVTNTYDTNDRISQQEITRQGGVKAKYFFLFSEYWNIEAAPIPSNDKLVSLTTSFYDSKKREWGSMDATGFWTTSAFDGQDHVIWTTDILLSEKNKGTGYTYDGNQNLIKTTDALGYSVSNTYDDRFRLIDTTDPLGNMTSFTYDDKHHLLKTRDPIGNTITATYLASGMKDTTTDARGTITRMTYDAYYNPWTTRTGSHPEVTYAYDSIGRMTSLTDQEGATTTFTYDKRNLLLSKTDPLGRTTSFTYDDAGRMTSRTDRNSHTTTYAYTPSDKVEKITYPDATTVNYTYNILDNLTSMQDATGTTTYTYDPVNRITSQTDSRGFVVHYAYDLAGNLTELTYPGDRKVLYTYDDLYLLKTVRIDWLNQEASYAYDEAGRLISLTNFNGTVTTYGYDNAGRPTSIDNAKSDNSTISSYRFTLDGNGNRTGVEQNEPLQALLETKDTAFTYNEKKNRLLTAGNNAFGYDKEGQLSSGYEKSYTFDFEHRLKSVGEGIEFIYDGKGTRIRATRDGVMTNYVYDAGGNLLAEADKDGNILRYYIHGKGLLAVVTETPTRMYCYHYNATGSTIAMTDETQTVVNQYSYDPHGNILTQQEQIPQSFKYVGQYGVMAEPNGFYYMRARYYDPQAGRFISEDPIGFDGGDVNLYAYVANNSIIFIDPQGTSPAAWIIKLTEKGIKKISSIYSTAVAREARRQGENVLAPTKQAAKAIERGAFGGKEDVLKHKGHDLANGTTGNPHFQTPGKSGHTFWSGAVGFMGSLIDPFNSISGELAGPEYDMLPIKSSQCK